jgi:hypothetical protein
MSTQTCTEHGEDVVVYQGVRFTPCPLCAAASRIGDLEAQVERLDEEVNGLGSDLCDAQHELADANRELANAQSQNHDA